MTAKENSTIVKGGIQYSQCISVSVMYRQSITNLHSVKIAQLAGKEKDDGQR